MQTDSADIADARRALDRVHLASDADVVAAAITRLRGLTNRVYRIEIAGHDLALRIPGIGSEAIIDRRAEEANARIAAAAGLAPEILHFGADGLMLTRFVADAVPLSAAGFRERAGAVERAATALRTLHDTATPFVRDFGIFQIIESYADLIVERGTALSAGLAELIRGRDILRDALARHPASQRPSHCDPTGANLLDTGTEVILVDWEYAGMNDPAWDLAYLSIQSSFDPHLDERLMSAYFGRSADAAEVGRIEVCKALVELMSALWALVQASGGARGADFVGYADSATASCRARLRSPAFAAHLAALQRG